MFTVEEHGIRTTGKVFRNLNTEQLYEEIVRRGEGNVVKGGPVVVRTGQHTGRAAKDKFIVREPNCEKNVWWGKVNVPTKPEHYDTLRNRVVNHYSERDLFVQDCYAGADSGYRLKVRVITENAWHSLFARNMFLPVTDSAELESHKPEFTVIHAPSLLTNPELIETNSQTAIMVNFDGQEVLICGSQYAGEIKKSVFTFMNYKLPLSGTLTMHCSANIGKENDTALFFGLSGTGKTTLSADVERKLIGDDEHGWSDKGVFNFEGGCYAKVIRLSEEAEPQIFRTTSRYGTILENVIFDENDRSIDLDDDTLTENTRASYPISQIENAVESGKGDHPRTVIFLTADAFGVMPPVAKLTKEQAIYHFLSGYTAKVAGTEKGVTEPSATFSSCFGAPFMALNPVVYADLLGENIEKHNVNCYLINTGWSGGPFGVGSRIRIQDTRMIVKAALEGTLEQVETETEPFFGLNIPKSCPGVDATILNTRNTWTDKEAYDEKAIGLAKRFEDNFKQFENDVSAEVKAISINS